MVFVSLVMMTLFMSCIAADISSPSVCYNFPFDNTNNIGLIINNTEPTYTFKQTLNILNTFNQFDSNHISIVISQFNLENTNGNMSWLSTADVYIYTQSLPKVSLLHYSLTEKNKLSSFIELPAKIDTNTLDQYLSSGSGSFLFVLTGNVPTSHPILNATICFSAQDQINKKIF